MEILLKVLSHFAPAVLTQINSIYKSTYTNQSDPIFDSKQNAQIATQLTLTTSL